MIDILGISLVDWFTAIGIITTVAAVCYFGTLLIGKTVLYVWRKRHTPVPPSFTVTARIQRCVCGKQPMLLGIGYRYGIECYACRRFTKAHDLPSDAIDDWNRRVLAGIHSQQNLPLPANSTPSSGSTPE